MVAPNHPASNRLRQIELETFPRVMDSTLPVNFQHSANPTEYFKS